MDEMFSKTEGKEIEAIKILIDFASRVFDFSLKKSNLHPIKKRQNIKLITKK